MDKFQILKQTGKARRGVYQCSNYKVQTPTFFCPTSRGVVPHLTPDNVAKIDHGSGLFIAAEDFMDKIDSTSNIPLMQQSGRDLMCINDNQPFVLSPRRSAPRQAQTNTDATLSIYTSEGVKSMPIDIYYKLVQSWQPDILFAVPDVAGVSPEEAPGSNRARKMAIRTEKWLAKAFELENSNMDIFAAMLPAVGSQSQREYLQYLQDNKDRISGLTFWQAADITSKNPKTQIEPVLDLINQLQLESLPRYLTIDCTTPHQILNLVKQGYDMFQGGLTCHFTNLGIALDFTFPVNSKKNDNAVWGRNMWEDQYTSCMEKLSETVESPVKYYKAYINHLLKAREMSAWVILQMHNLQVMDLFFKGIQNSLSEGTFEQDVEEFVKVYGTHEAMTEYLDKLNAASVGPTMKSYTRF